MVLGLFSSINDSAFYQDHRSNMKMKIFRYLLNGILCLMPGMFFSLGLAGLMQGDMLGVMNMICSFFGSVLLGNGRRM